ncbi:MAG: flagellar basal body rod protein FlgB [Magnetococcales bacterium]|nr:flagellar basal body rod protein FlgB [Magnetococcales bacterium]NGZ07471.1 flagellar basal body rod protein FlgB [Magnetococcales bacterium]
MAEFGLLGGDGAFKANLMNLRHRRQEIIASNIANVDTPGYKARRLEFEDVLRDSMPVGDELPMARTARPHMPMGLHFPMEGDLQEVETPIPKGDQNSVDLEQEMARQSANQLLYNYAAQSMNGQINQLRMVIQGSSGQ